jgi:hypothetical protein
LFEEPAAAGFLRARPSDREKWIPAILPGRNLAWRRSDRITVQEVLEYHGVSCDHIAIRTFSYTGIDQQTRTVRVHAIDASSLRDG